MNLPIIAIRPEPGCSATVAAVEAVGLRIEGWPLFAIRPVAWEPALPGAFDGLLVGSANAIRHAGPGLDALRHLPVYAVGQATASIAEEAGFRVAATGGGGLQSVLDELVPRPARLLRLAGADHVALDVPPEIGLETRIVYESVPLPMPEALVKRLEGGALVLLHSAEAARHFAAEFDRISVQRESIILIALGPRIAAAAGSRWRELHVCSQPDEATMLALLRGICHGTGTG